MKTLNIDALIKSWGNVYSDASLSDIAYALKTIRDDLQQEPDDITTLRGWALAEGERTGASELDDIIERTKGCTPGKWVTGENTVAGVRHYGVGIDDSYKMVALTGWVGEEDAEESIANARLIESVPDLLRIATEQREQIRELRDALAELVDTYEVTFREENDDLSELTKARAVLAKYQETKTDEGL